ncbi:MAG TPA: acetylxylan esterase [Acidobacteriaceae bacterium]
MQIAAQRKGIPAGFSSLRNGLWSAVALGTLLVAAPAVAQFGAQPVKPLPPPAVTWTWQQDHQNMMDQLGITELRPGKNSAQDGANPANYDDSKANPYPNLPDPLVLKNGQKVTTAEMWWKQRRPEIEEDLSREMYGRVPKNVPKVTWEVKVTDHEMVGRIPVIAKHIIGHVDNSSYPLIDVNIDMVLVTPANVKGPVPVLMMFGGATLPAPAQPSRDDLTTLNEALRAMLAKSDPSIAALLDKYPAYEPIVPAAGAGGFGFGGAAGAARPGAAAAAPSANGVNGTSTDPPTTQQLIADGWGYVGINPGSIQADNGADLTRGVIGLVNKGEARKPEDWGALRAWAWGAARALDYLETDATVDAKHVGIEGVSRYGKAALVTEAFDQRFYMGLIGSSGEGGAKLSRRNYGEAVENLTADEYHWMAGNFLKYGESAGKHGVMTPGDLPVDAHDLIAMCAPRLTFISYGIPERGDAHWLDHEGSYMATIAAQPVFQLLGTKTLGVSNDYKTEKMPAVNTGLLDGQLAWRQHDGGHTDAPNVKYFIAWADKNMGRTPPPQTGPRRGI